MGYCVRQANTFECWIREILKTDPHLIFYIQALPLTANMVQPTDLKALEVKLLLSQI